MAGVKEIDLGPVKGPKGDKGDPGERGPEGPVGPQGKDGVVNENTAITFQQATKRLNIASGEKLGTILGKVSKFFADLKAHAFEEPVQNLTTNVAGKALDATMGKELKGEVDALNSALGFKHLEEGQNILTYAEAILSGNDIVIHKNITFGNSADAPIHYSNGFISKRANAVFVCLFDMNTGTIYTNAKAGSENWNGWKKIG